MPEPIVTLNEESLKSDLRELVRKTVEDTLNGLLDEEAGDLVGAERYERAAGREAYRAGHYDRSLATTSGEVTLRMPKLKGMRFTTAIIERYRRRETSVEEAMIEMYLAGVSTRRIEDVSEILWGSSVSAATVSNLNEKAFAAVEEWRNRPLVRVFFTTTKFRISRLISFGFHRFAKVPHPFFANCPIFPSSRLPRTFCSARRTQPADHDA